MERYFKGEGKAEIVVDDPEDAGFCALLGEESEGEGYVLFLAGDGSRFTTNSCAGSIEFTGDGPLPIDTGILQAVNGPGQLPLPGSALDHDRPNLPMAALAVLGPLAFLAGAAFVWPRGEPQGG